MDGAATYACCNWRYATDRCAGSIVCRPVSNAALTAGLVEFSNEYRARSGSNGLPVLIRVASVVDFAANEAGGAAAIVTVMPIALASVANALARALSTASPVG